MRQTSAGIRKMLGGKEDIKRICGDGLFLKMDSNDRGLEITGDGCRITMAKNRGTIRIVGDGCRLRIHENTGDVDYNGDGGRLQIEENTGGIEYNGDSGHVSLGASSSTNNVRYVGSGGKVERDSNLKHASRRTTLENERNIASERINITSDEPSKSRCKDTCDKRGKKVHNKEEVQNALNEKKEAERIINDDRRTKQAEKSERNVNMTSKIVTSIKCDGQLFVKKWFVNPGAMIKTFDGTRYTTIVSRQSKTSPES